MFEKKVSPAWLAKVLADLPSILLDHAHLERRAATTALSLIKYRDLYDRVAELNGIALEELQHFKLVLNLLRQRDIPFGPALPSAWISGLMRAVRKGSREQVIDHLICCALIEGRSCEKFQALGEALEGKDPELCDFYRGLVESEGNHYATFLRMARALDPRQAEERLRDFLALEGQLSREDTRLAILH